MEYLDALKIDFSKLIFYLKQPFTNKNDILKKTSLCKN